jgi:transposase
MGDLSGGLGFDPAAGREGVPQRQVARDLGIGRSTMKRALASQGPLKSERPVVATALTPFEPLVRQLLKDHPDMPVGGDRGAGRVDGVDHVVS